MLSNHCCISICLTVWPVNIFYHFWYNANVCIIFMIDWIDLFCRLQPILRRKENERFLHSICVLICNEKKPYANRNRKKTKKTSQHLSWIELMCTIDIIVSISSISWSHNHKCIHRHFNNNSCIRLLFHFVCVCDVNIYDCTWAVLNILSTTYMTNHFNALEKMRKKNTHTYTNCEFVWKGNAISLFKVDSMKKIIK